MLIDIATGVDTCADRVDLHDDGEEQTKAKSKVILNTFYRRLLDHHDPPHVDDAQHQVQV